MNHCATCGTLLPPGSQFCPKCGADLRQPAASEPAVQSAPAVPPPSKAARHVTMPPREYTPAAERAAAAPPVAERRNHWWLVPLVIIGVVVAAFLLLMGLPFGGRDDGPARTASAETETIAEGPVAPSASPASTGTLIDLDEVPPQPAAPTTTTTVATTSTVAPAPVPATTTTAAPPPARVERPAADPPPMTSAAPPPSPSSSSSRSGEISEEEAVSTLRGFLVTRNYYQTGAGCLTVASEGYSNTGYTLSVRDRCGSRSLGRWRVDSKTREVFRQREDGRYLRP